MIAKIFGPRSVPGKFRAFPKVALRPSQIRASAVESALMILDAFKLRNQYPDLKMPVVIVAGEQDGLIDIDTQSARLQLAVSTTISTSLAILLRVRSPEFELTASRSSTSWRSRTWFRNCYSQACVLAESTALDNLINAEGKVWKRTVLP
jgi:hypothetical protein